MAITVCRETRMALPRSAWDSPWAVRISRTRFFMDVKLALLFRRCQGSFTRQGLITWAGPSREAVGGFVKNERHAPVPDRLPAAFRPRAAERPGVRGQPDRPQHRCPAGQAVPVRRTGPRAAGRGRGRRGRYRLAGPLRLAAAAVRGDRARLPAVRGEADPADVLLGDRATLGAAHHHRGRAGRAADAVG